MMQRLRVGAVIPARDEEDNIAAVVGALRAVRTVAGDPLIDDIVVCDNGSTDATAQRARDAGARVVHQRTPGYGIACLTAIAALTDVDVVLFVDGDQSFDVGQTQASSMPLTKEPTSPSGRASSAAGSRALCPRRRSPGTGSPAS